MGGFEKKEARGGERLKTEEEVIKEEREKLEKLEEDRLKRMRGEEDEVAVHRSVEDMGDGDEGGGAKIKKTLTYKDGVLVEGKEIFEKPDSDAEEGEEDEKDEDVGEGTG